jgi:hypothetical protein
MPLFEKPVDSACPADGHGVVDDGADIPSNRSTMESIAQSLGLHGGLIDSV